MSAKVIRLTEDDPEFADSKVGKFITAEDFDIYAGPEGGPVDLIKPDGSPLAMLRPGVIPLEMCEAMKPVFRPAAHLSANRAVAAGAERTSRRKSDGSHRKFMESSKKVHSGIAGFMDGDPKIPHCRATAYTRDNSDLFVRAEPFVQIIDGVFRDNLPERHAAQREAASRHQGDWSIFGTSFSTITVNRNFRTACHRDAGDYKEGFGVMASLITGNFSGGVLVFPRYRAGVFFNTGDVLLADVHEVHGNTPFVGRIGKYERISLVFYYRKRLLTCGSAEEEFQKSRSWGTGKITL